MRSESGITPEEEKLYALVPELDCRGMCYRSCFTRGLTPSAAEQHRGGVTLPLAGLTENVRCPALTLLGLCSIYPIRPMICRLWGAWELMPCNIGCRPKDGRPLLTAAEGVWLLGEAMWIGGPPKFMGAVSGDLLVERLANNSDAFLTALFLR